MSSKITIAGSCLCILLYVPLFAQTHTSISLENQIYYILEQAEVKGLCSPLSGIRPYTRSVVITAINEILETANTAKLNAVEREILEQYLEKFNKPKTGIDWQRGGYYGETVIGKNDTPLSLNIGAIADIEGSAGIYQGGDLYWGMEIWLGMYINGDLGRNISYEFTYEGGLVRSPRKNLGTYYTYYEGFPGEDETDDEFANRVIDVYSEPLTHFPYTYKKRWDSSVFFLRRLNAYDSWPNDFAGGYRLPAELTVSLLENKLIARLGRISHEWASVPFGSSLALNKMARPFLAMEAEFNPVSWFGLAALTGILEYNNLDGIKDSALNFQNAFSLIMMQFKYKNYIFLDIMDAVIYPKRLELGYISPITNNFFYQNNIGDFDNMAITLNLKAQYPGLGNIWFSFFVDEMNLLQDFWTLDRQMVAIQGGANISLPFLAFSSIKLSYTKVNPYCYTHNRNFNPWHSDLRMETAYTNNGAGLGYYLPPNSDEILVCFKTMPVKNISAHLQYQLIRHGADFGSSAVDGSNYLSELGAGPNEEGRNTNPVLKRFFLQDGAYQWSNVIMVGLEWNISKLPVTLYGEAGVNYSYFTNIKQKANVTGKAHPYSRINTSEYPESTSFIAKIGVKIFPR